MNASTLQVPLPPLQRVGGDAGQFGDDADGRLGHHLDADGPVVGADGFGFLAGCLGLEESSSVVVGQGAALAHAHSVNCSANRFTTVAMSATLGDMSTARTTTPTGVPIEDCGECGRRHPVTRSHCGTCGSAAFFCHPGADRTPAPTGHARKDHA